jgi:hypothetical protein
LFVSDLPLFPYAKHISGPVFKRVLFTWLIHAAGRKTGLESSQRQILSRFNRSNRNTISRYLKEARDIGLLRLVRPTDGLNPDVHKRGQLFDLRTREGERLIRLSSLLWKNQTGLLNQWPFPSAWGHGCIPPAVILCLATLSQLDEPIQRKTLRRHLEPLVPESSFNDAMRWMKTHKLLVEDETGISAAADWKTRVARHIQKSIAGIRRQWRGDLRRHRETLANRARLKRTLLTKGEQLHLRTLPCVWPGCSRRGTEMEHFPPRRFLSDLPHHTNRHLVWSICEEHNDETQVFVKALALEQTMQRSTLCLSASCSPLELYDAVAEIRIQQYYTSYLQNDVERASRICSSTLQMWMKVAAFDDEATVSRRQRGGSTRQAIGKKGHNPRESRLARQIPRNQSLSTLTHREITLVSVPNGLKQSLTEAPTPSSEAGPPPRERMSDGCA